jgi:hypothetical protein
MKTKKDIWLTLAQEAYPNLSEDRVMALCMEAANQWYNGDENELTKLFDQYVMLKGLMGIGSDE